MFNSYLKKEKKRCNKILERVDWIKGNQWGPGLGLLLSNAHMTHKHGAQTPAYVCENNRLPRLN
jgi:hypothetical protein